MKYTQKNIAYKELMSNISDIKGYLMNKNQVVYIQSK